MTTRSKVGSELFVAGLEHGSVCSNEIALPRRLGSGDSSLPGLLRFLLLEPLWGQLDELRIKQAPDFNH